MGVCRSGLGIGGWLLGAGLLRVLWSWWLLAGAGVSSLLCSRPGVAAARSCGLSGGCCVCSVSCSAFFLLVLGSSAPLPAAVVVAVSQCWRWAAPLVSGCSSGCSAPLLLVVAVVVVCLCGGQSAPSVSGCSDPLLLASLLLVVVVRLVVRVVRQVGVLALEDSVGWSLWRWLVPVSVARLLVRVILLPA